MPKPPGIDGISNETLKSSSDLIGQDSVKLTLFNIIMQTRE